RRSWPNVVKAIKEVHDVAIGKPYIARTWYANNRASIGVGKKTAVPSWLDYELWQGPAPRRDFQDNVIHYNWHWIWNWGTGEGLEFGAKGTITWEGRSCNGRSTDGSSVGVVFYGEKGSLQINGGNEYKIYDLKNKRVNEVKNDTKFVEGDVMNPSQALDAYHIQ